MLLIVLHLHRTRTCDPILQSYRLALTSIATMSGQHRRRHGQGQQPNPQPPPQRPQSGTAYQSSYAAGGYQQQPQGTNPQYAQAAYQQAMAGNQGSYPQYAQPAYQQPVTGSHYGQPGQQAPYGTSPIAPYWTRPGMSGISARRPSGISAWRPVSQQQGPSGISARRPVSQQQGSYSRSRPQDDGSRGSLYAMDQERLRNSRSYVFEYGDPDEDDSNPGDWSDREPEEEPELSRRRVRRERSAELSEDAEYASAYSRSASRESAERMPPPRVQSTAANVTIQTLQDDLQVPPRFEEDCFRKAEDFGSEMAYDDHARVQSALRGSRFRRWIWHDDTRTLVLRANPPRDSLGDRIEPSEFSILSHYVTMLAQWMPARVENTIPLTFFCGSYKAVSGDNTGSMMICDMLRCLCHQLLSTEGVPFNPQDCQFSDQDFQLLFDGNIMQLEALFERLVASFGRLRSESTLICFIDGLNVVEQSEERVRNFLYNIFRRVSRVSRLMRGFSFKVLLTQPGGSDQDWSRLDDQPVILVDVPDRPVRDQRPELSRADIGVTNRCLDKLLPRPSTR